MNRILTGLMVTGIILAIYSLAFGSSRAFFLSIAIAVTAWVVGACWQDVRETSE